MSWTVVVVLTGFVMCGCVYVFVFCNVWVCVCVGFVMCVSFGNMCTCIYCVLYCWYCAFCIVWFVCMFSYFVCLYCHRVTTQLLVVVVVIIIIIIIIIIIKIFLVCGFERCVVIPHDKSLYRKNVRLRTVAQTGSCLYTPPHIHLIWQDWGFFHQAAATKHVMLIPYRSLDRFLCCHSALHCTTLYYTALHYTALHYTTLHYTALHYTTLHYTTLHYTTHTISCTGCVSYYDKTPHETKD
jgi:hypothetical protein